MARQLPFLWHAYSWFGRTFAPLLERMDARRQLARGMAPERLPERSGYASVPRPNGALVWLHGVSVGETRVALSLANAMAKQRPELSFLLTTTTATAAKVAEQNLPPRSRHQFAPLDTPAAVRRFYDHWEPSLGVFTESELWPRLIVRADRRGVPLALVNARLSERSLSRWRKLPRLVTALFSRFSFVAAQTEATAKALEDFHSPKPLVTGDLKSAAPPLKVDPDALRQVKQAIGRRPVWIAASTHEGEEALVLEAHRKVLASHSDALLIIAPRHPERGAAVAAVANAEQRSKGGPLNGSVYIADTMGELGLWYSLGAPVFLGGSLFDIGGHNPFEPAAFACPILSGPHVTAFAESYPYLESQRAVQIVDKATLGPVVADLLKNPEKGEAMGQAAKQVTSQASTNLTQVTNSLLNLLDG